MIGVLSINLAHGFLFWPDKPAKPQIMTTNPDVIAVFDGLYNKYPNILQQDIDTVHSSLVGQCLSWTSETDDSQVGEGFAQLVKTGMCNGLMTSMIESYIDQLGMKYWSSEDGNPPQLVK